MLGGPGETRRTCEESITFAERQLAGRRFLAVFFVGVRVLPGTALAAQLVERGELAADRDLSEGCFTIARDTHEAALLARIQRAIARNPSIVHAAESGASAAQALMGHVLQALGVAPPYWRHLPHLLRLQPLRYARPLPDGGGGHAPPRATSGAVGLRADLAAGVSDTGAAPDGVKAAPATASGPPASLSSPPAAAAKRGGTSPHRAAAAA
jgi:hypothetical protein